MKLAIIIFGFTALAYGHVINSATTPPNASNTAILPPIQATYGEYTSENILLELDVVSLVMSEDITCYTWTGNRMANGEYPSNGYVANNEYPFGTKVEILDNEYVVGDRIGHGTDWDVYKNSFDECVKFGRQYDNVEIL